MPLSSNVDEVQSFLGTITYYFRNPSPISHPLRMLLQKNRRFYWSSDYEAAFTKLKMEIASDRVLMPFNPDLPFILACDASPRGITAILSPQNNLSMWMEKKKSDQSPLHYDH